jgi:FOG: Ankyrin repeat
MTPLYHACWYNKLDSVKILIEHNADIDAQNDMDYTPLSYASEQGFKEVVKYPIWLVSWSMFNTIFGFLGIYFTKEQTQN